MPVVAMYYVIGLECCNHVIVKIIILDNDATHTFKRLVELNALCNYLMSVYGIDSAHHIIAANEGNCTALAAGYDGSEKPTSAILRKRLNYIASDEEVRNTAKELDVHYVLQLENPASSGVIGDNYKMGTFRGVSEITDDTPGFEVVLSEGNMRLYKITLY